MSEPVISLETKHTGLYFSPRAGLLETLHYGGRIRPDRLALQEKLHSPYGTDVMHTLGEESFSLTHLGMPLSPLGKGDVRDAALEIEWDNGAHTTELRFVSSHTRSDPLSPDGLPSAHSGGETLVLDYESPQGAEIRLIFTAYPDCDVITARMALRNTGEKPFTLRRALSYQLDLPGTGYTLSTFTGAWARERHRTEVAISNGAAVFGSTTGVSSHYCNPFFMVSAPDATENAGEVYGFNLIYSGSHFGSVAAGPFSKTRIMAGIQPQGFAWTLQPGESFDTPEAVWSWSAQGKNGLSRNMHRFVQDHIVRGIWAKRSRPVLLNNWEATYFNFKEATLLRLAREAKALGIELFVLDDGWFGKRNSDTCSLGDYEVNRKKLPSGLEGLAKKIKALGLDFGLWMEPEMVNPDSDLYRAHPDWAVQTPGIEPSLSRNQLVLDLCREEVQDYIVSQVCKTLDTADISYVKWDMNRPLTDAYSPALTEQGRFAHAWVRGLYRVLTEIVAAHPNVLFEGCASGGNRFDLGILCYMPQIWLSDDTDAWERMRIQTGSSYGYPQSVMGCHVSASPNHQTMRGSPIEGRFGVAAFGLLGYELDLTVCSAAEKKAIAAQIAFYKAHRELLQFGRLYRLRSPFEGEECAWIAVSENRKEAIVLEAIGRLRPNTETPPLRLMGLNEDTRYRITARRQYLDVRNFGSLVNMISPVKLNTAGLAAHAVADHYMMLSEEEQYSAWGDLLTYAGFKPYQRFCGTGFNDKVRVLPDYGCRIYTLTAEEP